MTCYGAVFTSFSDFVVGSAERMRSWKGSVGVTDAMDMTFYREATPHRYGGSQSDVGLIQN